MINIICDHVLANAHTADLDSVGPDLIRDYAAGAGGGRQESSREKKKRGRQRPKWSGTWLTILLAALGALGGLWLSGYRPHFLLPDVGFGKDPGRPAAVIYFNPNSSQIAGSSATEINRVVESLKLDPQTRVQVTGYTDNTGAYEANLKISRQRAAAVKNQLVQQGIAASRIEVKGRGPEKPVAPNDTADGRQRNRRVEIDIVAGGP
jgi:outer membrane protein OmpA-like peptidoglycan-associated protein